MTAIHVGLVLVVAAANAYSPVADFLRRGQPEPLAVVGLRAGLVVPCGVTAPV